MTPERLQERLRAFANALGGDEEDLLIDAAEEIAALKEQCRRQLFTGGSFTLHSGEVSDFKIDCDALTDVEIAVLAKQLAKRLTPFTAVQGVPRGGLRLAEALRSYVAPSGPFLIVDDVLTTGLSMEAARHGTDEIGAVLFARGPCSDWITPLFQLDHRGQIAAIKKQGEAAQRRFELASENAAALGCENSELKEQVSELQTRCRELQREMELRSSREMRSHTYEEATQEKRIAELQERFTSHTKAVERFLSDMLCTMVDPLADGITDVKKVCETLLRAATEQRQREYEQTQQIAAKDAELGCLRTALDHAAAALILCGAIKPCATCAKHGKEAEDALKLTPASE